VVVVFAEMLEHNLTPSRTVTKQLIRLACDWGLPRLALQVAERFEALPESLRIDSSAWVHILAASAQAQYLDGVDKAWGRTVVDKSYSPDEGLVLRILAVAGRWGRTRLAYDALACLPDIGVEAQEHHMAPLVEALCREGRVPDALKLVASIRKSGIVPTISTVQPIANVLTTPELLDQAFYAFEDMHKAGAVIDVAAFNAVIAAAQKLGDLQRARATQLAAADLGVTPDIHTFNYMIAACRSAGHYALGETLMAELAAAGLTPTEKTYEHMVHLALSQPEYEHVFYFLETMKSAGFKPRAPVYLAIGKKLARRQDERYKLVAEEMATLGYKAVDFVAEAAKPPRGGNRDRERGDRPERANRGGQRYDSNSSGDRRRQGADGGNGNRRPRRDQTQNQDQNQNSSE
jgi:pentatricopeptide repeat protein